MKKYYSYRIKSDDGVLSYVGKVGNKIVYTPICFSFEKAAFKVAKLLRIKTGKLHEVFDERRHARNGGATGYSSIPPVDSVNAPPFHEDSEQVK